MVRVQDRYGLETTMSRSAAAAFDDGMALAQDFDPGFVDAFERAARADPSACLPALAIAVLGAGVPGVDVARRLSEAESRSGGSNEREQSLVRLARLRADNGVLAVDAATRAHLRSWPRDVLALTLLVPALSWSGRPGAAASALELIDQLAPAYGDDWWFLGLRAFGEQERGRYDEAFTLAERSLTMRPRSLPAAHARAHVHYETGDHAAGHEWLSAWWGLMPPTSGYYTHLSWHLALHELARGDLDAAVARYTRDMSPGAAPVPRVLVDGASLAWRCRLRDVSQHDLPGTPIYAAVEAVGMTMPNVFLATHVALAAAAAEDAEALGRVASAARRAAAPHVGELVAPLADALRAYVEGRYEQAVQGLAPLVSCNDRFGGSHAQRDVLANTLIAAQLRAGLAEEARSLLANRLDRRTSPEA